MVQDVIHARERVAVLYDEAVQSAIATQSINAPSFLLTNRTNASHGLLLGLKDPLSMSSASWLFILERSAGDILYRTFFCGGTSLLEMYIYIYIYIYIWKSWTLFGGRPWKFR